jgi:hypothetical protein
LGVTSTIPLPNSSDTCRIKREIVNETWYQKLFGLWYFFSMAVLADLIVLIPVSDGVALFTDPHAGGTYIILRYLLWLLVDLAILWISTLIFIDEHLQHVWQSWDIGNLFKRKQYSRPAWLFLLVLLFTGSVMFDITYWTTHSQKQEEGYLGWPVGGIK